MNVESSWTVYRTRFVVRARQLTQPLSFVNALGREHSGQAGDYLIETPAGCRSILPQSQFEDIYVPLGEHCEGRQQSVTLPAVQPERRHLFAVDQRRPPGSSWRDVHSGKRGLLGASS